MNKIDMLKHENENKSNLKKIEFTSANTLMSIKCIISAPPPPYPGF